jgi:taurine---2-oxoglutarate transaminase
MTLLSPISAEAGRYVYETDRAHVFHSWSAQALIEPHPIAGGKGSYFWDHAGNRFLDFSSQLILSVLGHQHPRVVEAIKQQADRLCYIAPSFAEESRSTAARLIAEIAPAGLNKVFFTNGGADAIENAVKLARGHTGRRKVLSAYRSYHGATALSGQLTGDPRRWASEGYLTSSVHFWGPFLYRSAFYSRTEQEEAERALDHLRNVVLFEDGESIAAILLEPIVGSNGVLLPPGGYLQGVREICDEFGIVMIADEVMSGFGRTGRWLAVDHWAVTPDLITFAKGVNSGYAPLGGVIISDAVAASYADEPFWGGLTYFGHPLGCAAAVGAIEAMKEERVVEAAWEMGLQQLGPGLRELASRHPSLGEVRGVGAFWALELVKNRETREPLVPYGQQAVDDNDPMRELSRTFWQRGLNVFINSNRIHVGPPCNASPEEVQEGISIIDDVLKVADKHSTSG